MGRMDSQETLSGAWWKEKHDRVRNYVAASSGARKSFVGPGKAGATYIDPFCGPPERVFRDSSQPFESGAIAACRRAQESGCQFSEVHIGDTNSDAVAETARALEERFGVAAVAYEGQAQRTVPEMCSALNPYALHLAFLDPFDISNLDFGIVKQLAALPRIDMIAHVSASDVQRNLPQDLSVQTDRLERFAPGWRHNVDLHQSQSRIREDLYEYWRSLVEGAGMNRSDQAPLVRGSNRQPLYYLMFLSKHPLADRLWNSIQNLSGTTRGLGI